MDSIVAAVDQVTILGLDPEIFVIKAGFLVGVMLVAYLVQRYVCRLLRHLLDSFENLPSASILVSVVRVAVWAIAILLVLRPVFGIEPTGAVAALGVTSVALSLGLKDTISNLFGGFALMVGKVIRPGDYVTIAGTTGTVHDVMLRHTVIETRLGEHIVIPNSVLNTTSVTRLPGKFESRAVFEFTIDPGFDADEVVADMIATVKRDLKGDLNPEYEPTVYLTGISSFGTTGKMFVYAREGLLIDTACDEAVRAVSNKPYFSDNRIGRAAALLEGADGVR